MGGFGGTQPVMKRAKTPQVMDMTQEPPRCVGEIFRDMALRCDWVGENYDSLKHHDTKEKDLEVKSIFCHQFVRSEVGHGRLVMVGLILINFRPFSLLPAKLTSLLKGHVPMTGCFTIKM